MGGIAHIATVYSDAWCTWVLFAMVIAFALSELFQPGVVSDSAAIVFARSERSYKQTPDNFPGQLFASLFRLGMPALALLMAVSDRFPISGIAMYGIMFGLLIAMRLINLLGCWLVDYTFELRAFRTGIISLYANIATLVSLVLFPTVLILLRIGNLGSTRWVLGLCAAFYVSLIMYRLARVYLTSVKAAVYILIYVLTLEVLPLGALIAGVLKMTSIL